jgi:Na+-transporting NADH:ubiquinone oxidoreductase subunit NqrF
VEGKDIENLTDSRGEFVLYFKNIVKTDDVTLKINGEDDDHHITVEEGKTVSTTILIQ